MAARYVTASKVKIFKPISWRKQADSTTRHLKRNSGGSFFKLKYMLPMGFYQDKKSILPNLLEELRTQKMLESENSSNVEVKNMLAQRHTDSAEGKKRMYLQP